MANTKNQKPKKAAKPAKKQAVSKTKPVKKTTEKKAVKKNILTTDKKAKKTIKTTPVKTKKVAKKKVDKKTKKTTTLRKELTPKDVFPNKKGKEIIKKHIIEKEAEKETSVEVKSEAVKVEDVLKTTPPSITPVVEEVKEVVIEAKKEEIVNPNKSIGILPVDDDDDENIKNNATSANNIQKVYTFNKGIEFMDGHLKIGIDNTNIGRRNDTIFDIYGKSEHGAEFKTEFECIDKEEGDFLSEQLSDCEKNPAPFMKGTPTETAATTQATTTPPPVQKSYALDANGNIDMTKLSAAEIMSIQNGNMPVTKEQPNFAGVPLTAVNIDEMINNLPPKTENQNITTNTTPSNTSPVDISNILNNQSIAQIEAYGKSIQDHIDSSFQANVWGGMPQNDVRLFLKNCDSQYLYDLVNDEGKGFYLKIKKDSTEIRLPKNPNEYLKVK